MTNRDRIDDVLASHGLAVGQDGYSWTDLVGLVNALGWHAGTEEVPRPTQWTRYRAIVWRPSDPRHSEHATLTARGRGLTEEQALAAALAGALERFERIG